MRALGVLVALSLLLAAPAAAQGTGDTVPPGAPDLRAPEVRNCQPYGLALAWSAAEDDVGVARYEISIADESGASTVVATVDAPAEQPASYARFVEGEREYPLAAGARYEVAVRAVDGAGNAGEADREQVVMPPQPPAAVTGLRGAIEGTAVRVAWDAAPAACSFAVYRDETPLGTVSAGETGFVDSGALHGRSTYSVVALDRTGGHSLVASVDVVEPLPDVPAQPTCAWRDAALQSASTAQASMASICLVNHIRVRQGLEPVYVDARLQTAAEGHARDQVVRGYYDHTSPEGCGVGCRAEASGYPGGSLAENIFKDVATARTAVDGWMESAGHRTNMLSPDYSTMGSGTAVEGGERMWVHAFGDVRAPLSAPSGLELRFQGAADPSGSSPPGGGGGGGGLEFDGLDPPPPRHAAKLRIDTQRTVLRGRRLSVFARTSRRLDGRTVKVTFRARGRTFSFRVRVRRGKVSARRVLPRGMRSFRRATLTVRYTGDSQVRPERARVTFGSYRV